MLASHDPPAPLYLVATVHGICFSIKAYTTHLGADTSDYFFHGYSKLTVNIPLFTT